MRLLLLGIVWWFSHLSAVSPAPSPSLHALEAVPRVAVALVTQASDSDTPHQSSRCPLGRASAWKDEEDGVDDERFLFVPAPCFFLSPVVTQDRPFPLRGTP